MSKDRFPEWLGAVRLVDRLTMREREVFWMLAEGSSNEQMARSLFVTERTVRAHISSVMTKLQLNTRLQACLAAYVHRCDAMPKVVADDMVPANAARQNGSRPSNHQPVRSKS